MKVTVQKPVEIDVRYLRVVLPVDDLELPDNLPCRNGDVWDIKIDVDNGVICNWPGLQIDVYRKVRDSGSYYLLDDHSNVLARIEENYVPNILPGEYGDYIDLKIAENGRIVNWLEDPEFDDFTFVFDLKS